MAKVGYLFKRVSYSLDSLAYAIKENPFSQTVRGVEGVLNAGRRRDPHHPDDGEEEFQPVVCDTRSDHQIKQSVPCNCKTDEAIKKEIRDFADSYAKKYGGSWSWRFETLGNDNCHTFQKRMIEHCKLDKFKDLLKGK